MSSVWSVLGKGLNTGLMYYIFFEIHSGDAEGHTLKLFYFSILLPFLHLVKKKREICFIIIYMLEQWAKKDQLK